MIDHKKLSKLYLYGHSYECPTIVNYDSRVALINNILGLTVCTVTSTSHQLLNVGNKASSLRNPLGTFSSIF